MNPRRRATLAILLAPLAPSAELPAERPRDVWAHAIPGHPVMAEADRLVCAGHEERREVAAALRRAGASASPREQALLALLLVVDPALRGEGESVAAGLAAAAQGCREADPALSIRLLIQSASERIFDPSSVAAGLAALEAARQRAAELDLPALVTAVEVVRLAERAYRGVELGELRRELDAIEAAVGAYGAYPDQLLYLSTSGLVDHELGDALGAVEDYERLAHLARRHCRSGAEASALIDGALARVDTFEPTDALRHEIRQRAAAGLRLATEAGAWFYAAQAHGLLADFVPVAEAEAHLGSCVELAAGSQVPELAAICRLALAARRAAAEPAAAVQVGLPAFSEIARAGPRALPYLWADYFRAVWQLEPDLDRALHDAGAFFEVFETYFDYQPREREEIAAVWTEANDWLVGRLLDGGRSDREVEAAFRFGERMRARSLLESRHEGDAEPLPEAATRRLDELASLQLERLRLLWQRRAPGFGGAAAGLAALDRREEDLRRQLDGMALPGTSFRLPQPAALADVQRELAAGEAMLIYHLGADENTAGHFAGGAWLLVVRRSSVRVHRLRLDRWRLDGDEVRAYLRLEDPSADPDLRSYLYDLLLRPALDDSAPEDNPVPLRRLIVVPDRALFMLPFGALAPAGSPGPGEPVPAAGAPVIAGAALQVVPSATLWLQLRRSRAAAEGRSPLLIAAPELAAARRGRDGLPPLPAVRGQAPCLRRSLGRDAELWLGPSATEARLREADLRRYGSLWLVAHATAVADADSTGRTAVHLGAGTAGEPGGADGDLTLAEIEELELDGRLVVLAACDTGVGQNVRGEGPLSLARAFFLAGARTVVATYWRVEDRATACWVGELATELRRGRAVDEALAAVQRRRLAAEHGARDWAATVVLGDGSYRPFPSPSSEASAGSARCCGPAAADLRRWTALVLVFAAVALLLWWGRRMTLQCPPS